MRRLTIFFTSDTHGYEFPTDYLSGDEKNMGVLACRSAFKKDGNTLVLDGGDTIQGSPFAAYVADHPQPEHPIATIINESGYDFVTLGNHEFNGGIESLAHYLKSLRAPCLCANVHDPKNRLPLLPYTIVTMDNGLRVGITGAVTDFVPVWETPEMLDGVQVSDSFEALTRSYTEMKGLCDITIALYHGGLERDMVTGAVLESTGENRAWEIASTIGFDILLTGHQHMAVEELRIGQTLVVQPPANAVRFLQLECEVGDDGTVHSSSRLIVPPPCPRDMLYERMLPLETAVQAWLDEPVGKLAQPLPVGRRIDMAVQGSAIADFFNTVQLEATGADISCTSLANTVPGFPATVSMRDVILNYPFFNTLVVREVGETELRAAFERIASYFEKSVEGTIQVSKAFLQPKVEHYNFDFFQGAEAVLDISRPVGGRVCAVTVKGEPIGSRRLHLVMSSYRATGTGGYIFYQNCPVVMKSERAVTDEILDYFRRHPVVSVQSVGLPFLRFSEPIRT